MAVDVDGAVSIGGDKAVVEVLSRPGSNLGDTSTVLLSVVVVQLVTTVVGAVNLDTGDGAVGEGGGGESANKSSSGLERHLEDWFGWKE